MSEKSLRVSILKKDQPHFLQLAIARKKVLNRFRRHLGCFLQRITVNSGRDRGQSNRGQILFNRQRQRIVITVGEQFGFPPPMLSVNWADSMNHVKRWQFASGRNHSFAGWQAFGKTCATNFATFFENRWPSRTMNRAVNSTATEERRICRINDCVDVLFSNIAYHDAHAAVKKLSLAFRVHERINLDDSPATT